MAKSIEMSAKERIEAIEEIVSGIKPGDTIDGKVLYDLCLHVSELKALVVKCDMSIDPLITNIVPPNEYILTNDPFKKISISQDPFNV